MLKSIKFKEDFRTFKAGHTVKFDKLTIITGDNGTGKSTIISCIRQNIGAKWSMSDSSQCKDKIEHVEACNTNIKLFYLDTFKDLYANSPVFDFDNMNLYLSCYHRSSGQGLFAQIADMIGKFKGAIADGFDPILILDEPERGLSLKTQCTLRKMISFLNENLGGQIIVTTHAPVIMSLLPEIYSTSHMKTLPYNDYIAWCGE